MRPRRKLLDDLRRKKKTLEGDGTKNNLESPIKDTPLVVDLTAVANERNSTLDDSSDCVNDSIVIISENVHCGGESAEVTTKIGKRKRLDDSIEICFEKSLADETQKRKRRRKYSEGTHVTGTDYSFEVEVGGDISCTVTSTTDDVIFIDSTQQSSTVDVVVLDSAGETSSPENSGEAVKMKKRRKKRKKTPLSEKSVPDRGLAVSSSTPTVIVDKVGNTSRSSRYHSPLVSLRNAQVDNNSLHNINGANIFNPNSVNKTGLRPVIIDGSNVAFGHGKTGFSVRGIIICLQYFLNRGHNVKAFVPLFRRNEVTPDERSLLDSFEKKSQVVFTPSRYLGGRCIAPYDDRFIVQTAAELGGVIVSNDNYRDLVYENPAWKETINKRLLMFTWVGDMLMFPDDPNGRTGPRLEEFLKFPE